MRTKSDLQEDVVNLFLRLNGYITSGLIIHSERRGNNKTQIDLIGVRFPFHSQDDRIIPSGEYLKIPSSKIDIIICEVKGGGEKNRFNDALYNDRDAIIKLVNWLGIISKDKNEDIITWLINELKPKEVYKLGGFPQFNIDNISIRPIVFNLDSNYPKSNQKRFVYGELMLQYIWDCFKEEREKCSITYPLNMWGHNLMDIVEFFKNELDKPRTVSELYNHFNVE